MKGNPSVKVKNAACLAFGGLPPKDVRQVWFGLYVAMKTALIAGQFDAFGSVTSSPNMREIEASPRGLHWPRFRPDNTARWKAVTNVVSFASPLQETRAAGESSKNPVWLIDYRYPMITTYTCTSEEETHNMLNPS